MFVASLVGCRNSDSADPITDKKHLSDGTITKIDDQVIDESGDDYFNIAYPEGLRKYSDVEAATKYPSANRPQIVYGTDDFSVTVGISLNIEEIGQDDLPKYVNSMKAGLQNNVANFDWISNEIWKVNDHDAYLLRFTSPSPDGKIYNLICCFSHNDKLAMLTFNCLNAQREEWIKDFEESIKSIYFEKV